MKIAAKTSWSTPINYGAAVKRRWPTSIENSNAIALLEKKKGISQAQEDYYKGLIKLSLLTGLSFNALLAIALAMYFNRDALRRLDILLKNTIKLSQDQPLLPQVAGTDEIAKLDKVFHQMAEALAAAIRMQRAVVDNALDVICALDENNKFSMVILLRLSPLPN
jgi:hypothetical protein